MIKKSARLIFKVFLLSFLAFLSIGCTTLSGESPATGSAAASTNAVAQTSSAPGGAPGNTSTPDDAAEESEATSSAHKVPKAHKAPYKPTTMPGLPAPPKLVLFIVVDQLRGDLPLHYRDRLGPGGFRFLMDQGTWYQAAFHPHSHTETIVGHTTLVTCAYPSRHGMIANTWFDRETGELQRNVRDPETTILGTSKTGSSPRAILTSTLSDELTIKTASRAKIFAVSQKDRAAVSLAGHTGKAFWFIDQGSGAGDFVTSTFYYDSYPSWVTAWNEGPCLDADDNEIASTRCVDRFANQDWNLLYDRSTYVYREITNQYPDGSFPEDAMEFLDHTPFTRTFPHNLGPTDSGFYYNFLTLSPFIDQLTLEFALRLIEEEGLGEDDETDYLGIGFSGTDIIGHWFSPVSLESEDNILQLDQTLERLFTFIDQRIGLTNTMVVLSGDHGMPEFPEYLETIHVPTGRLSDGFLEKVVAEALMDEYGDCRGAESLSECIDACAEADPIEEECLEACQSEHPFIAAFQNPYFYLDREAIAEQGLDQEDVELFISQTLMKIDGVELASSQTELAEGGEEMDAELIEKIRRNRNPERSGDVYVVQEPQWQIDGATASGEAPANAPPILLQHGSPWSYDTYVPVAFAGPGVEANHVARPISTVDVAATLAVYLSTKFPAGCVGSPLVEVLDSE